MIRYTLTCDQDHQFESWFQSSGAFDALAQGGHLECAICGSATVNRALMTPLVPRKGAKTDLRAPDTESEAALSKMRREVEENSDYVGLSFAQEARKMHDGEATSRPIYGEASLADAKKLIDDGIPVAPLPFVPKRTVN